MTRLVRNAGGFSLLEFLIASLIFAVVAGGASMLYVSAKHSLDLSAAETFVQRKGNLIEEELARHMLRATGMQVVICGRSGASVAAGQSVLYQREVQAAAGGALTTQFWCVFQDQPTGASVSSLYRCRVGAFAANSTCNTGLAPIEDLTGGTALVSGQALRVTNTSFSISPIVGALATTVDGRFDLDLRDVRTNRSLLAYATPAAATDPDRRRFGFNVTIRN